ncbi:ESCRT II complex subunit Vps25 [Schizosaccharomyces cryophilus OY26]|uniref:ESCRT II complex subunit Vps25 n=1 Tax=Schizosaccharomyces cryophilus (strain OY26 / ATCC MYA-4695 / CBS 11777 / NBRC 106824 / NRRL Y48691) TaxID=653667 RepID=S9VWZ7_SCHCR|nr:ESCRT II complex subunit Vps25 [Schizosaccharomyces cryophilus OY26]EPY50470.1 ESCRT II complex subunit Vps25 [Schizosaccharomyces cryophilus OY26]
MKIPAIYNFPPFFTRQVNENAWQSQKTAWQKWILIWCREHRITQLSIHAELLESPLIHNEAIHRTLPLPVFREIVEDMVKQSYAEWTQKKEPRDTFWVYWRSVAEWGNIIIKWLFETGRDGAVCTFYELQEQCKEVDCLEEGLLQKVLESLMKKGNVELMKGSSGKYTGFKVLSTS